MDLAMRPKANVITFEDVVMRNVWCDLDTQKAQETSMEAEDEEVAEEQRHNFMEAISKLNETKQQ